MAAPGLFELLILGVGGLICVGVVVAVVVLASTSAKRGPAPQPSPGLVPCPQCNHSVSPEATTCPSCGHPLKTKDE